MSQVENHLKWCLKNESRLVKIKSDKLLAERHLRKSFYNYRVLKSLEKLGYNDWVLNVGFYSIYHYFLALLANFGYSSKNQSCTISLILSLIDDNKLKFDKEIVLSFDSLNQDDNLTSTTIRNDREISTYGVETSIDFKKIRNIKEIILRTQKQTIKAIENN
jgi:uncharacterized protein (UPF0332 family)